MERGKECFVRNVVIRYGLEKGLNGKGKLRRNLCLCLQLEQA